MTVSSGFLEPSFGLEETLGHDEGHSGL